MAAPKTKAKAFHELTPEERRADFKGKNALLQRHYEPIPPALFYSDYLFHDMDEEEFRPSIIMYEWEYLEEEGKFKAKRQPVSIDDLMDYCGRDDVAVNPCGYYNNFPKKRLMRRVYAFVMDVDEVRPGTLEHLVEHIEAGRFPRPTAITNSGSGVHFFYILDEALQVGYREKYLQNNRLAQQIYYMLHRRLKDLYAGVQKHHLGQDYRVVGSLSKYGDVTTAWQSGDFWQIEELAYILQIDVAEIYQPMVKASPAMTNYAKSIAQELGLALPDLNKPREVYDFIKDNKDAAYHARQLRREQSGKKRRRSIGWYETTWNMVYTKTKAGNRFNAMRGLAIVAYKCRISEERFEKDINRLSLLWQEQRWRGGDPFNPDNVEAIMRMFRNGDRYKKTRAETLEEMLGFRWPGSNKRRDTPLRQADHVRVMNTFRDIKYPDGSWRYKTPSAQQRVLDWRAEHPEGRKADCHRDTGLDPKTIRKWWDTMPKEDPPEPAEPKFYRYTPTGVEEVTAEQMFPRRPSDAELEAIRRYIGKKP